MTVSTDIRRVQYATNGTTGPFTVTFPFLESSHLAVTYTDSAGADTLLTLNVDYTVSGSVVTTTLAYASGGVITIDRDIPITQELDLRDGDDFPAESVEEAFDKLTMIAQQVAIDSNRVLRVPEVSANIPLLPVVADRANKVLAFDANGDPDVMVPSSGSAADVLIQLANSASAAGDALIAVKRTDLTGASGTTQHEVNKALCVHVEFGFGFTSGTGLTGGQRTANGTAINAAIVAAKAIGGYVQLPPGTVEYDGSLIAANGVNVRGHGHCGEVSGPAYLATSLKYYGNGYAVDLLGTSASVETRIQCCWSDLVIDGSAAGASAKGVRAGWNMRSNPLLRNVTIVKFAHYGLHFTDQNWIVSFENLKVHQCGNTASNSAGIFKDASVDAGTWNAICFHNLTVEGCGSSGSTAGGILLLTTTANRGLHFSGVTTVEDNLGTNEIYISNMSDLVFDNLYIERTNVAGQDNAVVLSGCQGAINGGYVTGENVTNNLRGIWVKDSSDIWISGLTTNTWSIGGIVSSASGKVYSGRNPGASYASADATAQWFGDYSPRVSVHKNGTDQSGIATGVFTKVTFSTERYDLTGAYASSTFTPQVLGTYQVDACITWTAAADQDGLILSIYVNGAAYRSVTSCASGTGQQSVRITAQVDTNATTDTIEIWARQTSGSNKTINGAYDVTWFMANLIGRTA